MMADSSESKTPDPMFDNWREWDERNQANKFLAFPRPEDFVFPNNPLQYFLAYSKAAELGFAFIRCEPFQRLLDRFACLQPLPKSVGDTATFYLPHAGYIDPATAGSRSWPTATPSYVGGSLDEYKSASLPLEEISNDALSAIWVVVNPGTKYPHTRIPSRSLLADIIRSIGGDTEYEGNLDGDIFIARFQDDPKNDPRKFVATAQHLVNLPGEKPLCRNRATNKIDDADKTRVTRYVYDARDSEYTSYLTPAPINLTMSTNPNNQVDVMYQLYYYRFRSFQTLKSPTAIQDYLPKPALQTPLSNESFEVKWRAWRNDGDKTIPA